MALPHKLQLSNSNYQWITTLTRKPCVKSMKHTLNQSQVNPK